MDIPTARTLDLRDFVASLALSKDKRLEEVQPPDKKDPDCECSDNAEKSSALLLIDYFL